jgi:hypothetical protein
MFDINTLDPSKVTFGQYNTPGVKYISRSIIDLDKIYVPSYKDNPVRKKGTNVNNIQRLIVSLRNGINYSQSPPLVRKRVQMIDGHCYEYELISGNHRMQAFVANNYDRWIFDEYMIVGGENATYEDSLRTLQLDENDHTPNLETSEDDAVNIICRLLDKQSKIVEPNTDSIRDYLNAHCKNMHGNTKAKVIRDVIRNMQKTGVAVYSDIVTYTALDVNGFVKDKTDYVTSGEFDKKRKSFGWSVLEGYEYEYIMSAAKKFSETGSTSYFICHTKSPTEKYPIKEKRDKMINQFQKLETALLDVMEYYEEHKTFPWKVKGFLPQDKLAGEVDLILV